MWFGKDGCNTFTVAIQIEVRLKGRTIAWKWESKVVKLLVNNYYLKVASDEGNLSSSAG